MGELNILDDFSIDKYSQIIEALKNCCQINIKTGYGDDCNNCMFRDVVDHQCVNNALEYAADLIAYLVDWCDRLARAHITSKNDISTVNNVVYIGNIDVERELKNRLCLDFYYNGNCSDIDLLNYSLIAIEKLKEDNKQLKRANKESIEKTGEDANEKQNDEQCLIRTILNSAENVRKYYSFGWNDAIDNILETGNKSEVSVSDIFNRARELRKERKY